MEPFYRRPIKLKTVLLVFFIPLAALGIPALLWLAWGARPLNLASEYSIETPTLPTPNAHDLYLEADKAFEPRIGRDKPVARSLDYSAPTDTANDAKLYPLSGKQRLVYYNRRGFELFERAVQADYYFPLVSSAESSASSTPYHLRALGRYGSIRCEVLAAEGRSEQAVEKATGIWKMGLDAARGAPLTSALGGMAVEVYARNAIDGEIAKLDAAQAKRAAHRLEKLLDSRVSYESILRHEHDFGLLNLKSELERTIHERAQERKFEAAMERGENNFHFDTSPPPKLRGPIINWGVRRMAKEFSRGVKSLLPNANATWPKRQVQIPADLEPQYVKLIEVLAKSRFHYARADAYGQIIKTRLALHAYRKTKGVYPATLQELAPTYLAKLPLDPFSDGQLLRYRRDDRSYKLWSLGPDSRDDNARPALHPAPKRPREKFTVMAESHGDIVANISR